LMILMEMDWGWAIFSWSKQENQKEGTISLWTISWFVPFFQSLFISALFHILFFFFIFTSPTSRQEEYRHKICNSIFGNDE
jgi:hypothetical protein